MVKGESELVHEGGTKRVNITLDIRVFNKLVEIAEMRASKPTVIAGEVVTDWVLDYDSIEAIRLHTKALREVARSPICSDE